MLNRYDSIPSHLSGAPLWDIINQERLYMEEYTKLSIGSTAIADKFQPALMMFSMASLSETMELEGADVNTFKLGDLAVTKGTSSNLASVSRKWRDLGNSRMKVLGKGLKYYKAF